MCFNSLSLHKMLPIHLHLKVSTTNVVKNLSFCTTSMWHYVPPHRTERLGIVCVYVCGMPCHPWLFNGDPCYNNYDDDWYNKNEFQLMNTEFLKVYVHNGPITVP